MSTIDLRKKTVIDLKKSKNIEGQIASVSLDMDKSGSMENLYNKGIVQKTVERILPVGLGFDDNGEIDFAIFHDRRIKIKPSVTINNYEGYVQRNVMPLGWGGTNYAPIINGIMADLGITPPPVSIPVQEEKKSFFGGLFGKKKEASKESPKMVFTPNVKLQYPHYAIVVTDGDCFDREQTIKALIQASHYGIFFQFIGIGNAGFKFLEELDNMDGRFIDNANYFRVENIDTMSDTELYNKLFTEFPEWIKLAKQNNLINA